MIERSDKAEALAIRLSNINSNELHSHRPIISSLHFSSCCASVEACISLVANQVGTSTFQTKPNRAPAAVLGSTIAAILRTAIITFCDCSQARSHCNPHPPFSSTGWKRQCACMSSSSLFCKCHNNTCWSFNTCRMQFLTYCISVQACSLGKMPFHIRCSPPELTDRCPNGSSNHGTLRNVAREGTDEPYL